MKPGLINDRWELQLPDFRVQFHADRPLWEAGRLADCFERMAPGWVVFDCGAEHGDFTTLYRQWVGSEGEVIPVEPCAHYWPFIRETFVANGWVPPPASFVGFVGDHCRDAALGMRPAGWPDEAWGIGVPDGGFLHLAHAPGVPSITLDALAARTLPPDAVVLDIEGAELHAMRGAAQLLEAKRTTFWVSVHEETMWNWYRATLDDLRGFVAGFGYSEEELPHHGEGETFWRFRPMMFVLGLIVGLLVWIAAELWA